MILKGNCAKWAWELCPSSVECSEIRIQFHWWMNQFKTFFVSWFQSFDLNKANGDVNNGSVGYFNKAFVHDVTPTNDVKIPIDTKVTHATANDSVKRKQTRSRGEPVTLEEENWDVVELEDNTTPWKGTVIIFVLPTLFSNSAPSRHKIESFIGMIVLINVSYYK